MSSEFHFSPRPNRAHEINWQPWSPEAFERASGEDKPILLSISAVWCHWCHVMDETTYSEGGVIDLINREYVPVRVDNDVRPDINQRYNMGGWPTTAFLTPQGDILTGATYLPADQMSDALSRVAAYYRDHKPEVVAGVLEGRQRAGSKVAASAGTLDGGLVDRILGNVESAYDATYGGFGNAPKFPQTDAIALLAEQSVLRREPQLVEMAKHTLARMAGGGTYDHVEGGFFRYSTTQDWSVPHYEKMLEDHAGLVSALALTGQAEILDDAVRYLETVLRDPQTGLYAGSQDADEEYYSRDAEGRAQLTAPYVDRRVYVAWNCALAVGYLEADLRLERPQLRERAEQLLEAVFTRYRDAQGGAGDPGPPGRQPGGGSPPSGQGGLLHSDGVGGQLPDQVWGLLAAVRMGWTERARELAEHLEERYADPDLGGYFDHAGGDHLGRLTERIKPLGENSIAAIALHELGETERARRALESVASLPRQYGIMAAVFARALDRVQREPIKVTSRRRDSTRAAALTYPYAVVEDDGDERAVICIGTTCLQPVATPEDVVDVLTARI